MKAEGKHGWELWRVLVQKQFSSFIIAYIGARGEATDIGAALEDQLHYY